MSNISTSKAIVSGLACLVAYVLLHSTVSLSYPPAPDLQRETNELEWEGVPQVLVLKRDPRKFGHFNCLLTAVQLRLCDVGGKRRSCSCSESAWKISPAKVIPNRLSNTTDLIDLFLVVTHLMMLLQW